MPLSTPVPVKTRLVLVLKELFVVKPLMYLPFAESTKPSLSSPLVYVESLFARDSGFGDDLF